VYGRVVDYHLTSLPEQLAGMEPGFELHPAERAEVAIPLVLEDPSFALMRLWSDPRAVVTVRIEPGR
jgi:hypothetical protein